MLTIRYDIINKTAIYKLKTNDSAYDRYEIIMDCSLKGI